jgi:hypothetical protein
MRRLVAFIFTAAILGARFSSASERPAVEQSVTVQIHDYAQVPNDSLSSATAMVSRMYEKIGVRIEWMGVVRQGDRHARSERREETSQTAIAQMTIIILTPKMAARGQVAEGVLGFAAVADEGMGRICYAIFDRVRSVALSIPTSESQVLGFVMAHEIGHLLLPRGSHSVKGLMRDHWDVRDLRRIDLMKLQFSEDQATQIRATIDNESSRLLARRESQLIER